MRQTFRVSTTATLAALTDYVLAKQRPEDLTLSISKYWIIINRQKMSTDVQNDPKEFHNLYKRIRNDKKRLKATNTKWKKTTAGRHKDTDTEVSHSVQKACCPRPVFSRLDRLLHSFGSHLCGVVSFRCEWPLAVVAVEVYHLWWQTQEFESADSSPTCIS